MKKGTCKVENIYLRARIIRGIISSIIFIKIINIELLDLFIISLYAKDDYEGVITNLYLFLRFYIKIILMKKDIMQNLLS